MLSFSYLNFNSQGMEDMPRASWTRYILMYTPHCVSKPEDVGPILLLTTKNFSRFEWVYLMRFNSEAIKKFWEIKNEVENQIL